MIIRLIIAAILFYVLYRITRLLFLPGEKPINPISKKQTENLAAGEDLVEDPYCHTYIPISNAFIWQDKEKTIYFCSRTCMEKYRETRNKQDNQEDV